MALSVGLVLAFLFAPGHGMNIDPSTLDAKALSNYAENAHKLQGAGVGSFILNIIPTTSVDALARNDVLQVLFFAILFGIALALVGEPAKQVASLVEAVSKVLFKVMGLIVRVAPLGVLGAVAYTVGRYGVGSLKQLISLVLIFYARSLCLCSSCSALCCAGRFEYFQFPRLFPRGVDHRPGDRVVGRGAAADHA